MVKIVTNSQVSVSGPYLYSMEIAPCVPCQKNVSMSYTFLLQHSVLRSRLTCLVFRTVCDNTGVTNALCISMSHVRNFLEILLRDKLHGTDPKRDLPSHLTASSYLASCMGRNWPYRFQSRTINWLSLFFLLCLSFCRCHWPSSVDVEVLIYVFQNLCSFLTPEVGWT